MKFPTFKIPAIKLPVALQRARLNSIRAPSISSVRRPASIQRSASISSDPFRRGANADFRTLHNYARKVELRTARPGPQQLPPIPDASRPGNVQGWQNSRNIGRELVGAGPVSDRRNSMPSITSATPSQQRIAGSLRNAMQQRSASTPSLSSSKYTREFDDPSIVQSRPSSSVAPQDSISNRSSISSMAGPSRSGSIGSANSLDIPTSRQQSTFMPLNTSRASVGGISSKRGSIGGSQSMRSFTSRGGGDANQPNVGLDKVAKRGIGSTALTTMMLGQSALDAAGGVAESAVADGNAGGGGAGLDPSASRQEINFNPNIEVSNVIDGVSSRRRDDDEDRLLGPEYPYGGNAWAPLY